MNEINMTKGIELMTPIYCPRDDVEILEARLSSPKYIKSTCCGENETRNKSIEHVRYDSSHDPLLRGHFMGNYKCDYSNKQLSRNKSIENDRLDDLHEKLLIKTNGRTENIDSMQLSRDKTIDNDRFDDLHEELSIKTNGRTQNIDSLRLLAEQIRLLLAELELKTLLTFNEYKEEKIKLREKVQELEMVIQKHDDYNLPNRYFDNLQNTSSRMRHRCGLLRMAPPVRRGNP